jgi:glycosyltransferase involved in cell wall biosynthesis
VTAGALAGAWRDLEALGVRRDARMVLFAGSFGRSYDLAPLLEAARTFAGDPSVQFVIAGDGERGAAWRDAARGSPNVVLTGWVDGPKVAALLDGASIGVAAYAEGALQGLPNKLLEYLAAGIPVVSSLAGEAAALLARHECGLTYAAREPATLLSALETLLHDADARQRMGRNARATYLDQFTSERITERLIAYLDAAARRVTAA